MEVDATLSELRKKRLDRLYDDCRNQVISQLIGPFGLSTAMFQDRNGGNVTTVHNFERDDDSYVATENDRLVHAHSKEEYKEVREQYEVKTQKAATAAGHDDTWDLKREKHIDMGVDRYTGASIERGPEDSILQDGTPISMELDHVVSISEMHGNARTHLALATVKSGKDGQPEVDASAMAAMINSDANLALTNKSINASKSDSDLKEWADTKQKKAKENGTEVPFDSEAVEKVYSDAKAHVEKTVDRALLKKQAGELLTTGSKQAMRMGIRQSMGVLLTELVQSLFTEVKELIAKGVAFGKELLKEIGDRLLRIAENVARKLPEAGMALFEGGISGFVSNLLTFILNNFLSTAKRFVSAIREGLFGLLRAMKMIFFPPSNMTADEALQVGLKILGAVLLTTVGTILGESVVTFLASVPILAPIAQVAAPALMGILTGLLSAFLAYQIDGMFDRYRHQVDEKILDAMLADSASREILAERLVEQTNRSVETMELNLRSIASYAAVSISLDQAAANACTTSALIGKMEEQSASFVRDAAESLPLIESDYVRVDAFLLKHADKG